MASDFALVLRATHFAAVRHRNQRRKDGTDTPYINHPLDVARLLAEVGRVTDPEVLAAAVLHDTVEDTGTTRDELAEAFGGRVAGIVSEVTDDKSLPKAERKRLQIRNASQKSNGAKLVKLGDKLSNLMDLKRSQPVGWSVDRVQGYFVWAERVVDGLSGTNEPLERLLSECFAGVFDYNGAPHPCLPEPTELDKTLQNYLDSL